MASGYASFALTDLSDRRLIRKHVDNLLNKSFVDRKRDAVFFNSIFSGHKIAPAELRLYVALSKSQLHQDLFVLSELNFKRGGFFVEFGATNGVDLSNTHLLETQFGWTGILAEPARVWHKSLKENCSAAIETRCIWNVTGQSLTFAECIQPELSTLASIKNDDVHKELRSKSSYYSVDTISLNQLLEERKAPLHIDYLSIDTEGSELEILSSIDFKKYSFEVITCEHNYTTSREKIHELLANHGYARKLEQFSQFDDWYVKA